MTNLGLEVSLAMALTAEVTCGMVPYSPRVLGISFKINAPKQLQSEDNSIVTCHIISRLASYRHHRNFRHSYLQCL